MKHSQISRVKNRRQVKRVRYKFTLKASRRTLGLFCYVNTAVLLALVQVVKRAT